MIIGIPKEIYNFENRVAATPESVHKFCQLGFQVKIENDAGDKAGFSNQEYQSAGAEICNSAAQTYANSDIILKIHAPEVKEYPYLQRDMTIIGNFKALDNKESIAKFAKLHTCCFALDLLPRISRAQSMDILSSQSNLAGYRAVLEAVTNSDKAAPLLMTSAGTIPPIKALILGVGVAGLQAIATAKRLGAQVYASDIRPETKEQTESLGGKFITTELNELLPKTDIVIASAIVAGKKSPLLLTDSQIQLLPQGSVIVDMATANGGNIEGSKDNQIIYKPHCKIIGNSNFASLVPHSASKLFANNLYNFIDLLYNRQTQQIALNFNDDIINKTCVCNKGEIR